MALVSTFSQMFIVLGMYNFGCHLEHDQNKARNIFICKTLTKLQLYIRILHRNKIDKEALDLRFNKQSVKNGFKETFLYLRCADRYLCHYCVVCKLCIIIFFKILIQKCVQGQARVCKNMCVFLVLAFLTLSNNDPETEKAIHFL